MILWMFLGLAGLVFAAGVTRLGWQVIQRARERGTYRPGADLIALTALVPVALFSVYPYLGDRLVGAGDSYHYALQAADFVTQARAGVMPVFVGQSDYAFNGNIHTLRTAPYYTHLTGLLDFATRHRLSFVRLQNLTVTVTAVLAAWAAYGACLYGAGGLRLVSVLLAAIYVLGPAIVRPLALNDMFATYMAAPWLVLSWCGLGKILQREGGIFAHLLAAGALAVTWYAHSPIAAWLSLAWVISQSLYAIRGPNNGAHWKSLVSAGLLFAGIGAYAFASIFSLGPGAPAVVDDSFYGYSTDSLLQELRAGFLPFVFAPTVSGIQLGWITWLLLIGAGGIALVRRNTGVLLLLVVIALFLPYLIPTPAVSELFWRALPTKLVVLTNWPTQRLCPLLGAGIVVAFSIAGRAWGGCTAPAYRFLCLALGSGVVWSAIEVAAVHRRSGVAKLEPAVYRRLLAPENLTLTRSSYALFRRVPPYFTQGWTDPEFESRLLDSTGSLIQENSAAVQAAADPLPAEPIGEVRRLNLSGPREYLLVFGFAHPELTGEITIQGPGIGRAYTLPRSGESLAFGAEKESAKAIPIWLREPGAHQLTITSSVKDATVQALPISRETLPVQILGQTPYRATVQASASGSLETPHVYLEGYAATVNGHPAAVGQSRNGLVTIPVSTGKSEVVLTYPGPSFLRIAWWVSLASLGLWPWLLVRCVREPPGRAAMPAPDRSTGNGPALQQA
jgi:hypothetical protein